MVMKKSVKQFMVSGIMILGTGLVLTACGGPESIVNDVQVEFSGYSGDGTGSLNYGDIHKEIYELSLRQAGISKSDAEAVANGDAVVLSRLQSDSNTSGKLTQAGTLVASVSYELDKYDGLSNGDKVVLTVKTSSKESPVKAETKEFTVEGLKEYEVVKLEDLVSETGLAVSGFETYGTLSNLGDALTTEDTTKNLKNGDTVELSVDETYLSELKAKGKTLDKLTYTYQVADLKPIDSITNLSEMLTKIDTYAKSKNENTSWATYQLEPQKDYVTYTYGYDESTSGQVTLVRVYKLTTTRSSGQSEVTYRTYGYQAYLRKDGSLDLETANEYYGSTSQDYEYLTSNLESQGYKVYTPSEPASNQTGSEEKAEETSEE